MVEDYKIAGKNIDRWIDEPQVAKGKVIKNRYERLAIAILDILGIKALVEDTYKNNEEHIAIDKIQKMRRIATTIMTSMNLKLQIDYLSISDSFVFICEPKLINRLVMTIAKMQFLILLECNQLLRGAVTIGDAKTEDQGKYVMGPAYIRAYLAQEKDSIYPRIIIDNCVKKEILKTESYKNFIFIDSDKECYLNYLKIYMDMTDKKETELITLCKSDGLLRYLEEQYKQFNTDEEENHNKKQKYGWTIEYFKKMKVWG